MKNRYFSPQHASYSSHLISSPSLINRNKYIGSTSKLPSTHSMMLCQTQRKIGSYCYDITRQIGSGYSSKVYKGRSVKDDNQYAVKVIQLKKYNESSLKMLNSQIQILKKIDHPNLIKCYDVFKTSSHCFIITEYCSNGDLLSYITRRGKLQETVAVEIMSQIIEGVKYLLQKGILHRDLKPANILNNKENWKIADFGFAIYAEGQIKTKYNVGTPLYMPLQALLKNIYSPSSDMFSVGVIFYELLTGITPWQCKNEKQLIKKMNSLPYSLSQKYKINIQNRNILERLCSIDINNRPTKQQFMALKLRKDENPESQDKKLKSKRPLQTSNTQSKISLQHTKSNINLLANNKSVLHIQQSNDSNGTSRIQIKNNHILINQLHYCRFIYYLTRNLGYLLVSQKNRNKLTLILFRHLQKLIKNLSDSNNNWFRLKDWDNFKESKKYMATITTMKEYCVRYERQYLNCLKKSQFNLIRDISKQLSDSNDPEILTIDFYKSISNMITPIIRQANHNVAMAMSSPPNPLTTQLKSYIQALKSILKYHNLIESSMNQYQNFQKFERTSAIKVQIDYSNPSNIITIDQYRQLRQELRGL